MSPLTIEWAVADFEAAGLHPVAANGASESHVALCPVCRAAAARQRARDTDSARTGPSGRGRPSEGAERLQIGEALS